MVKKFISAIMTIAMVVGMVFYFPPAKTEAATDYSGTYYIRNMSVGLYLNPVSGTIGEVVRTNTMVNTRNQSWIVEADSSNSNFYTIRSAHGNYYLTAENNGSSVGTRVILTSASSNAGQLWTFAQFNGGYKIIPKTNTNLVVSVLGSGSSGGSVGENSQMYLTNATPTDSVNQEAWYLYKVNYKITVNPYYDGMYQTRYGSSATSTRILKCLLALKKRMIEAGIEVNYLNSTSKVTSYVEHTDHSCVAKSGVNTMCNCGTCSNSTSTSNLKNIHHTNYYNILYRWSSTPAARNINTYFIGHKTCYSAGVSHVADSGVAGIHGTYRTDKRIAMIMDFQTETDHEQMIFVRTILQMYGLIDHTGTGDNNCVFGNNANSSSVRESCTLCSSCQAVLRANADTFN